MKTAMPPVVVQSGQALRMVGCGILHKEVDYLIDKNGWNVETHYLDSSLHNYLGKLSQQLDGALFLLAEDAGDLGVHHAGGVLGVITGVE